jgi:hypothetical protein
VALLNQRSKHGNGCIRGARETPSCLYPYMDLSEPPGEVLWDKGQGITGFDSGTPKTPDATVLRGNSLGRIIEGWCSAVTNAFSIENGRGVPRMWGGSRHVCG